MKVNNYKPSVNSNFEEFHLLRFHLTINPSCLNIFDSMCVAFSLDPHKLGIRCRVNGNVMQDSNTENLVFKTEALVSFISR